MLELHGDSPQHPTAAGSLAAAAEFAGLLDAAATEQERLCLGVRLVAELLGCEAGLMLRARPDAGPTAASVPAARDADRRQIELDEGPSLDALRNATIVVANDVAGDVRWPTWSSAVAGLGVRSAMAVPVAHGDPRAS